MAQTCISCIRSAQVHIRWSSSFLAITSCCAAIQTIAGRLLSTARIILRLSKRSSFRFFTDPATRAPALESGAADIMGELAPLDALALARRDDITLLPQPIPGMPLQFMFNTRKAPYRSA
jgi:hypothetical protein